MEEGASKAAFRRITRLGIPVTEDFVAKLMVEHDHDIGKVVDAALSAAAAAAAAANESTSNADLLPSGGPEQAAEKVGAEESQAPVAPSNRGKFEADSGAGAAAAGAAELSLNVALHKPCWQSSCFDAKEHPAKNAVDGIWQTGQRHRRQLERAKQAGIVGAAASFGASILPGFGFNLGFDTIFSHTKLEKNAWLAVDLCATHEVEGAAVFNRTRPLMRLRLFPSWIFLLPEDRDYAPLSQGQGQTARGETVGDILALLVPAEASSHHHHSGGGRQGVVPGLLDRVRRVAVASQRLTIDMEGADDCPIDGKISHRVVCREFSGRGRYVVLMLEGKDYLNVVQLQVWGRPVVVAAASTPLPLLEQGDEPLLPPPPPPAPTRTMNLAHSATPSKKEEASDSRGGASSTSTTTTATTHGGGNSHAAELKPKQQQEHQGHEQLPTKGQQRHHIHATVAAKYAARRAQKRAERDQLKSSVSTAIDSTSQARQAAVERNEALSEMGDKANALASNTNEYLEAARRLNSR